MLGDLIYGVFMISVLYISADLMKKYKSGIIKNNTDLAMYFAKKSFKALKFYKKTKNSTKQILNKCIKQNNVIEHCNNNIEEYKLVCMSNNGNMIKALLMFEDDKLYLEENSNSIMNIINNDSNPLLMIFNKEKDKVMQINAEDFDITDKEKIFKIKNKIDNVEHDEKLFINVQLIMDKEYDISDHMIKYYTEGNTIFNKIFLEYFMTEYYEEYMEKEYEISIMDKNIVMETIKNNQEIKIYKKDDEMVYKIIKNE